MTFLVTLIHFYSFDPHLSSFLWIPVEPLETSEGSALRSRTWTFRLSLCVAALLSYQLVNCS